MRWCSNLASRRRFLALVGAAGVSTAVAPVAAATPDAEWLAFKARFVGSDGRVVDNGNGGISHSEGQSYALLLAESANDREAFDRIWAWTSANLARKDVALFAWRFDPVKGVIDRNNATDGDLLMAYALQRAATRWKLPAYAEISRRIRADIIGRLVRRFGGRLLLLPGLDGFSFVDSITVNPSYFVFPALDLFARLEPRSAWPELRDECLRIVREGHFGPADLPVDWLRVDQGGRLWSDPDRPPTFGYDAIRIPLYLLWSRRAGDQALRGIRAWWLRAQANGRGIPASINVATGVTSPELLSPGALRVVELALSGRLSGAALPMGLDYYASALWLLAGQAAAAR